jgi:hypothetical protein
MDTSMVGRLDNFPLNPIGRGFSFQTAVVFLYPGFEGCGNIPF